MSKAIVAMICTIPESIADQNEMKVYARACEEYNEFNLGTLPLDAVKQYRLALGWVNGDNEELKKAGEIVIKALLPQEGGKLKKSSAKKPAAKKPAAKKPVAKKPVAKKPAAKKPAAKKPVVKKPAAKKTMSKK